ncbi:hypothetical protein CHU95_01030, partial [Niveispirillum lacus]
ITTASATGTIRNDDNATPATLAIAAGANGGADKAEGNSGTTPFTFTVTRAGDTSSAVTANFAVTGSAVTGADFQGGTLPRGTVSFAAGETTKTITVNVAGDAAVEQNEAFTVTLSGATNGATITTASATGTIRNDDTATPATLAIAAGANGGADKAEGNSGTTPFTFTVTRGGDTSSAVTANFAVTGSAVTGADFQGGTLPRGTVSFAAGETTKTITVNVAGDAAVEQNEAFTVTLSGATNGATIITASATGTIRNDDGQAAASMVAQLKTEYNSTFKAATYVENADVNRADLPGVGSTGGQCAVYARNVREDLRNLVNTLGGTLDPNDKKSGAFGAWTMDNGAVAAGFHVDYNIPKIGAALVFEPGASGVDDVYGHVGIITNVQVFRQNDVYKYLVSYRDSNWSGNEKVSDRTIVFDFPGVQPNPNGTNHKYSFIMEKKPNYNSDVELIKKVIDKLYSENLLDMQTDLDTSIVLSTYQGDQRLINRMMTLNTDVKYNLFLDVLVGVREEYGQAIDLETLINIVMPMVLVGDDIKKIITAVGNTSNMAVDIGNINKTNTIFRTDVVGVTDQIDYFKIKVTEPGNLRIEFSDSTQGGLSTKLESITGVELSHSSLSSTELNARVEPGIYYVKVFASDPISNYTMLYDLI